MTKLVVIVGPTGSGKSVLGLSLAKKFDGEIINADSRSVYRYMDIGTAKPTREEMLLIPHHLVDIKNPDEHFSVADFKVLANASIEKIADAGHLPIMVGGTGLYIDSVLFDYRFETRTMSKTVRPNTLIIGIKPLNKEESQRRNVLRLEKMLSQGLIDEVRRMGEQYGWENKAMNGLAYRVFRGVVDGTKSVDDAKVEYLKAEKDYIKRQLTWFKRNQAIHWINDAAEAASLVKDFLSP